MKIPATNPPLNFQNVMLGCLLVLLLATSEPADFQDILSVISDIHYTPKIGPDGISHHVYHEDVPPVLMPPSPKSMKEFVAQLHLIPRLGIDNHYHNWYVDASQLSQPQKQHEIVTMYRSDISNEPLSFGKFFHKVGYSYDINEAEYMLLSAAEKTKFVLINNGEELKMYENDWFRQTSGIATVLANTHESHGVPVVKYRSDISNIPLELGKFYHKKGEAFDISDKEYDRLPLHEQLQFVRIMSKEDLAKYATDWSTPTVLNSNSEPEHEPVEFTHAVSPKNSKPEISEPTTPSKVQGSVLERPGWAPEIPSEVPTVASPELPSIVSVTLPSIMKN